MPTPDELKVKLLEFQARKRNKDEKSEAMVASKSSRNFKNKNQEHKSYDKGSEQRFKYRCHRCGKLGHMSKDCKWRRSDSNKKPDGKETSKQAEVTMKAEVAVKATPNLENKWCLDSGATSHMSSFEEKFENISKSNTLKVNLASSYSTTIDGKGSVIINVNKNFSTRLEETLLVPDLRSNLMSVAKITNHGFQVLFQKENATIIDPKTGKEVIVVEREQDLYFIQELENNSFVAQANTSKLQEWHDKFGHLNEKDLKDLSRHNKVHGINVNSNEKLTTCEVCIKGKKTRSPFPQSTSRSNEILELVHTDLCGPMKVESLGGSKYFATFIDDKSRWCEIYFLRRKNELFDKFLEFKAKVEKQTGKFIKTVRSDNGGEYRSNELEDYLKKEGIRHQFTVDYTPQQNGIAERKNRTLVEMATCMLIQSGLPRTFWAEAILTAVYIRNRCPSRSLDGKLPHEIWTGKIPTAIHFQIFGTKAHMLDKSKHVKFDQKTIECIFVGYSTESKVYRLWDPKSRKIRKSRDVTFINNFENQQKFEEFIDVETLVRSRRNISETQSPLSNTDNKEDPDNRLEITLTNKNHNEINTPEDINRNEEENNPPNAREEQIVPKMRIGSGRPTKILTGRRGRPKNNHT